MQLIPYHMPNGKTESIPKNHAVFNDKGEVVDLTPEGKAKLELKIEAQNTNAAPSSIKNEDALAENKKIQYKRPKTAVTQTTDAKSKIKFQMPEQMSARTLLSQSKQSAQIKTAVLI